MFIDDDVVLLSSNILTKIEKLLVPNLFLCGAKRYWTVPKWDREYFLDKVKSRDYDCIKSKSFVPKGIRRGNGQFDLLEYSFLTNFGIVHRENFDKLKGFDENYLGWGYEDTDLMFRLLQDQVSFKNLFNDIEILHLNHALGISDAELTSNNRQRFYSKTQEKGVIFKVHHLFGVNQDEGTDIFWKYKPKREYSGSKLTQQKRSPTNEAFINLKNQEQKYKNPSISIIMPTFNSFDLRKGAIELTLTNLENQTVSNFELIIINDGSSDKTNNFLKHYFKENKSFDLTIINLKYTGNRAFARNYGVTHSKSNKLLFLDDDTIFLNPNSIDLINKLFKPKSFMCGAKRFWSFISWDRKLFLNMIKHNKTIPRDKYFLTKGINRRMGYRDLFEYSFISNCGVVDKSSFLKVNGFDDINFGGWGREDTDLMLRLYINNVSFINLHDNISVLHLSHPILKEEIENRDPAFEIYNKREIEYGVRFKVNHLFGIFENDGDEILQPIHLK